MIQRGEISPPPLPLLPLLPPPWSLPLRPALLFRITDCLSLFSFGRKLKNCRCIEPAACRRLSGTPPSACKKGKWGFLERSYLSSPHRRFFKNQLLFTSSVFWGFRRISFLSPGFCVCVLPVKALPPLFLPSSFSPSSSLLLPCATSPRALSCVPYF